MESLLTVASGGIWGTLIGGLFRLVPAWFQMKDKDSERQHELAMVEAAARLEGLKAESAQRAAQLNYQTAVDEGLLTSLTESIRQQTEMTASLGPGSKVAALSASVRPIVTYWLVLIYSVAHFVFFFTEWKDTDSVHAAFKLVMTPDFFALVSGTINYWFLDRSLAKRGL
jgi:hypothetical protein